MSSHNPMWNLLPRSTRTNRWRSHEQPSARRSPDALRAALRAPQRLAQILQRRLEDGSLERLPGFGPARSSWRFQLPTAVLLWVAIAMVASNLTLVALRSEITRVRYELSQGSAELQQLDEESRALTLKLRELHDPRRLGEIARNRGFGPPERIVELP